MLREGLVVFISFIQVLSKLIGHSLDEVFVPHGLNSLAWRARVIRLLEAIFEF